LNTKIHIIKGFVTFLVLTLFGVLLSFLGKGLFNLWQPILSLIAKTGNPFLDFLINCLAVAEFMVLIFYVLGRFLATKVGKFFRKRVPILNGMSEQSDYLVVEVEFSEDFWVLGIIAGKQKKLVKGIEVIGPKVCVLHSLTSCFVAFISNRKKIRPTNLSPADVVQVQISMGFSGPEVIRELDDSELDSYFS